MRLTYLLSFSTLAKTYTTTAREPSIYKYLVSLSLFNVHVPVVVPDKIDDVVMMGYLQFSSIHVQY